MGSDFKRLEWEIVLRSEGNDFESARHEWRFVELFVVEGECVCGKAIMDNCVIEHVKTGERLIVGNVCVKRFLSIDYAPVFRGVKQAEAADYPVLNQAALEYLYYDKKALSKWEYFFCLSVKDKRKFSAKQAKWVYAVYSKVRPLLIRSK